MNFLLRIKHWQLFVLVYALPFLSSLGIAGYLIGTVVSKAQTIDPNNGVPTELFQIYADVLPWFILPVLFSAVPLLWRYKVVDFLVRERIPTGYKVNKVLFGISLAFPIVIGIFILLLMSSMFGNALDMVNELNSNGNPIRHTAPLFAKFWSLWVISIPLSLLNLVAQFYTYYETGRAIKSAELKKPANLNESILEMVLNWFFFVGIWILQPRINSLERGAETEG